MKSLMLMIGVALAVAGAVAETQTTKGVAYAERPECLLDLRVPKGEVPPTW